MPPKRKRKQIATPATVPIASANPPTGRGWIWWAIGVGVLLIIGLIVAAAMTQRAPGTAAATAIPAIQAGPVGNCRKVPRFATNAGYKTVSFATDDRSMIGLKMVDANNPQNVYQHPSWKMAGSLGPVLADNQGNVYVAPVPRINLLDNPPEQQNRIYKVDSNSGVMALFLELPTTTKPSIENPYGVLGLALDCETNSLYASSVFGSDRATERGRIFRIDLATGTIATQYEGTDAFGIGIYNTLHGKRLYFGSARASEIRSVALDSKGDFVGSERFEFLITAPSASGNDKARRISFSEQGDMLINGREFDFNMVANTFQPRLLYTFRYRPQDDGWEYQSFQVN
jgi:hypothetical protein